MKRRFIFSEKMNWMVVLCLSGGSLLLIGGGLLYHGLDRVLYSQTGECEHTGTDLFLLAVEILVGLLMLVTSYPLLHVASLSPSRWHSIKSLYKQYIFHTNRVKSVTKARKAFHQLLKNTQSCQESALRDILNNCSNTIYGRDHKFTNMKTISEFRSQHQLTEYKHYDSYVKMALEGTSDVLFPSTADYFVVTSGTTTGKSKIIPRKTRLFVNSITAAVETSQAVMFDVPGQRTLKRWLDVRMIHAPETIRPDVFMGPASSSAYPISPIAVGPSAVYRIEEEADCLYVHAFFGLKDLDVNFMQFMTSTIALNFYRIIEENAARLCDEIEHGTLSTDLSISDDIREELQAYVTPDPEQAAIVRKVFMDGCENIVQRMWPSCTLLKYTATGSYQHASEILRQKYIGSVPVCSPFHIASEGIFGVFVDVPDDSLHVEYTILPKTNFYEFIPEKHVEEKQPDTVLATEVQVGKKYEIVVTTALGLYRYRSHDLVEIVGFNETAPKYTFCQRTGECLMANVDKYPVQVFEEAMKMTQLKWKRQIEDYMATENIVIAKLNGTVPTKCFYYVFLEMEEDIIITEDQKTIVGECLLDCNEDYKEVHDYGGVGHPEVLQMKKGTFQEVKRLIISLNPNATFSQYKPARFMRNPTVLQYLLQNTQSHSL